MKPIFRTLATVAVAAFIIILAAGCGIANAKGSISGTVYIDGQPQAFGTVQAFQGESFVADNRCTDSGHYILDDLAPGSYTLVYLNARGVQFGEDTVVEVRLGRFEQVDIQLTAGN